MRHVLAPFNHIKKNEAVSRIYSGLLGSVDPCIPLDEESMVEELNKENSPLAASWKHDSIKEWKRGRDRARDVRRCNVFGG